jgi:superfamily II RNA helicase
MKIQDKNYISEHLIDEFKFWPFELSNFQKWAIDGIVNEKNVVVTAHTGSGKTLPAEFAVRHFTSKNKKVIYTTPIKALSNEKFNDLQNKFPNISFGILTGDIKYNPEADVLIMTTEILYNTLFQKMMLNKNIITADKVELHFDIDIETELGCVIFDEIHYINDKDRGRIWEESIMNLPNNVQIIGLSATIDRPDNFCEWIEHVKQRETWLCTYDKRIVPLTHHAFVTFPDSYYEKIPLDIKNIIEEEKMYNKPVVLKMENKQLKQKTYHKVLKVLKYFDKKKNTNPIKPFFIMNRMIEYLNKNKILPALCFVFSRKMTRVYAEKITVPLFDKDSTIPSTIKKECKQILMKLGNYREYISLPEFDWMTKLLEKGIGVHHSGITPVFRELVEILFGKGYIKLLFATETFAVGINMPTKAVVFSSLTKYDGNKFRYLHSHEYSQMSGRAGRRGKDTKGYVFHLNGLFKYNQQPSSLEITKMLSGKPEILKSKFKINFNSLLKMISGENFNFKEFIEKSMLNKLIVNEKNGVIEKIQEIGELKTPYTQSSIEDLERYDYLKANAKVSSKKRKKISREMTDIANRTKNFDIDYNKLLNHKMKINKKESLQKQLKNIEGFIDSEINIHLKILENEDFIERDGDSSFILKNKGKYAISLNEIHSLAMAEALDLKVFENLTPREIAAALSVFCSIRLSDQDRIFNVEYAIQNSKIISVVKRIKDFYNKYYDIETSHQTEFMFNYEIQYDIIELVYDWFEAKNEKECIHLLQKAMGWGIQIGNFNKAIMKICNITNEIESVCLIQENVDLRHKVHNISDNLMKFVINNQSLYL